MVVSHSMCSIAMAMQLPMGSNIFYAADIVFLQPLVLKWLAILVVSHVHNNERNVEDCSACQQTL